MDAERDADKYRLCCSTRFVVIACLFLCMFNMMYTYVSIVFAMVCMVKGAGLNITEHEESSIVEIEYEEKSLYEFEWSKPLQGHLISGFFYGATISQAAAGYASYRWGGRRVIIASSFSTASLTFLIPVFARNLHVQYVFGLRVLIGFAIGFLTPAVMGVLSNWAVPKERTMLFGLAFLGVPAANVVNFPLNAILCTYLGWSSVFYVNGIWSYFSCVLCILLLFDFPALHPMISQTELNYLTTRMKAVRKHREIPWKALMTSVPVYALSLTHMCHVWGFLTMVVALPQYMREVHKFNLETNGLVSATPYVGTLIFRFLISFLFEDLLRKTHLSMTVLRKLNVVLGTSLPAVLLCVTTLFTRKHWYWALFCIFIAVSLTELAMTGGYLPSPLDMAPPFAHIISSIINTGGNLAGILNPVFIGLVTANGLQSEWNIIFYVTGAVYLLEMIIYVSLGSSELQSWAIERTNN